MFGVLLASLAFLRRRVTWGTGWVWPVPSLKMADGRLYDAVISDGVGSPRGAGIHHGVDIMYRRRNRQDRPEYTTKPVNGVTNGSPMFFAPPRTPIVAARDGVIWSSGKTVRGGSVVIDHGKPFATYYTHMELLAFPEHASGRRVNQSDATEKGPATPVRAGDIIGWMGADPLDKGRLRHLHFEVWHGGNSGNAVDPAHEMTRWARPSWTWTP